MIHNKVFLGKVRQYRLFRAHVNFGTDSLLYPYDTQRPSLKFQSLDYADDTIHISTKTLNNLNGFDPKLLTVEGLENLSNIQGRSDNRSTWYTLYHILYRSHIIWLGELWNRRKHENYGPNSEWNWKSYSYNVETVTSLVRNNLQFSQLIVTFDMQRNDPFFSLTLFIPVLILTVLAPIGLILPGMILKIKVFQNV